MRQTKTETKLRTAVSHAVPDVLEDILSGCEQQRGRAIQMESGKNNKNWVSYLLAIAAALVLMVGGPLGYAEYRANYAIDSVIALDINPSVELKVNAGEKVLAVEALNEDAAEVLKDMELKGIKLDIAINAIIGSMVRLGYISELQNSVLITVANNDEEKGVALELKLVDEVSELLESNAIAGAVLGQLKGNDSELKVVAEANGISYGKAKLVQAIVAKDPLLTFEQLAALSVNELNLLRKVKKAELPGITVVGIASDKAYIGKGQALTIAYSHAEVNAQAASKVEVELNHDDGKMVYDVEFRIGGVEYNYEIEALTGNVIQWEKDTGKDRDNKGQDKKDVGKDRNDDDEDEDDDDDSDPGVTVTNYISEAQAKQIAFNRAGISASVASGAKVKLDDDDAEAYYEVEFKVGKTEYECKIDAVTGSILDWEKKKDD